jgi:hypothetical protein
LREERDDLNMKFKCLASAHIYPPLPAAFAYLKYIYLLCRLKINDMREI